LQTVTSTGHYGWLYKEHPASDYSLNADNLRSKKTKNRAKLTTRDIRGSRI